MRVLVILTFCLIAVVQSLTLAPRDPIRPTRFIDVIGYVNTTDEEVEHFDRVMCEKNGGSEAYQEYIDAKQNFSICIDAVENGIREEFHHIYPGSDISVRKFCAKIPEYEKCMTNFVESVKPCLDASKLETLHLVYNTSHSILQFLCEDDALRIRTYNSANGEDCTNPKRPDVLICANNTLLEYIRETVSNGTEIGGIGILDLLVPDTTRCSIFDQFQICVVNLLKDCPERTAIADLATSVFQIVKNVTTCDGL